jgi:Ca2+-transporting ATPase
MMTTIHQSGEKIVQYTKGAPDEILKQCTHVRVDGVDIPLSDEKRAEILSTNKNMADRALRVLAVGYKVIDEIPDNLTSENLENGLTFMGLLGMIDPPRPEAKAAVETCKKAGIKAVMITGDHIVTASAIARELGILNEGDIAITGAELDNMTDEELDMKVQHISVYARVSPENKIRIVKAWQRRGQVVSMTGDGVNDAPALKAADIGCAMGITGTDVAKGAADMTLTDDNFATIVEAVREGRGIYANIKKVVGFLLGTNIGEVITVFVAMLLWHKTPLLSMQLLWINLVTDSLPAIALGMEAVESDVMEKNPKPKNEGIFAHGLGIRIFLQGLMFALLTLIGFKIGENAFGVEGGQTMAFMILSLSQIVQSFNMRSEKSLFKIGPFTNKKLNQSALISIVLTLLVLFTPVSTAFGLIRLNLELYLIALGLIIVPVVVMELSKALGLIKHKH